MEALVEGWTEKIVCQLMVAGTPLNLEELVGVVVTPMIYARNATSPLDLDPAQYGIEDAPSGKVFFTPNVNGQDLLNSDSPYKVRWRLSAGGKDSFFPNDAADLWVIRKP